MSVGLRHDNYRYSSRRNVATPSVRGATNGRAAIIYDPTDTTTVKLLYGGAFRAPNPFDVSTSVYNLLDQQRAPSGSYLSRTRPDARQP